MLQVKGALRAQRLDEFPAFAGTVLTRVSSMLAAYPKTVTWSTGTTSSTASIRLSRKTWMNSFLIKATSVYGLIMR